MRMTASWLRPSWIDRIQVCGANSALNGELPSDHPLSLQGCRCARDCQGLSRFAMAVRPPLTATAPSCYVPPRSGREDVAGRTKRWETQECGLTLIAPYKCSGTGPTDLGDAAIRSAWSVNSEDWRGHAIRSLDNWCRSTPWPRRR